MSLPALADESLLRFYESGHRHFLTNSEGIKRYATNLRQEMERRRLNVLPIHWL